jgi:hypothetical protein
MAECTVLSDRMPAVLAGRDSWSPADQAHLFECTECAAEWKLAMAAGRVGQHLGYAPDAGALSRLVLTRLAASRLEQVQRRRRTGWAAALAAAAVALVLWSGRPGVAPTRGGTANTPPESTALVPELDSLDAGELREVLDAFDAPLSQRVIIGTPTLGDLSDQELERVLRAGGV